MLNPRDECIDVNFGCKKLMWDVQRRQTLLKHQTFYMSHLMLGVMKLAPE